MKRNGKTKPKEKMSFTKWEKETTINWNKATNIAEIYTRDEVIIRKLDRLCDEYPEFYKKVKFTDYDAEYECPKNFIKFAKPVTRTEEQRQAASERGKMMYEKYLKDRHKKTEE